MWYLVAAIAYSWYTMNKAAQAVFARLAGGSSADVTSHSHPTQNTDVSRRMCMSIIEAGK